MNTLGFGLGLRPDHAISLTGPTGERAVGEAPGRGDFWTSVREHGATGRRFGCTATYRIAAARMACRRNHPRFCFFIRGGMIRPATRPLLGQAILSLKTGSAVLQRR